MGYNRIGYKRYHHRKVHRVGVCDFMALAAHGKRATTKSGIIINKIGIEAFGHKIRYFLIREPTVLGIEARTGNFGSISILW